MMAPIGPPSAAPSRVAGFMSFVGSRPPDMSDFPSFIFASPSGGGDFAETIAPRGLDRHTCY
jgi:hypothetical protein